MSDNLWILLYHVNYAIIILIYDILITTGFFLLKTSSYIDPGIFSTFMAMIMGGIVGAGMTLKFYWHKIKQKISRNKTDQL